jgi:hypothetical protein
MADFSSMGINVTVVSIRSCLIASIIKIKVVFGSLLAVEICLILSKYAMGVTFLSLRCLEILEIAA